MRDTPISCPVCGYVGEREAWTKLDVSSGDIYAGLICREYIESTKEHLHIGGVLLIACPRCRIVKWMR